MNGCPFDCPSEDPDDCEWHRVTETDQLRAQLLDLRMRLGTAEAKRHEAEVYYGNCLADSRREREALTEAHNRQIERANAEWKACLAFARRDAWAAAVLATEAALLSAPHDQSPRETCNALIAQGQIEAMCAFPGCGRVKDDPDNVHGPCRLNIAQPMCICRLQREHVFCHDFKGSR